jgi:hypothetical protein
MMRFGDGRKTATVKGTGNGEPGVLRIDFPGYSGEESLQPIEWDEFFEKFDDANLAFVYQDKTAGGRPSRFNKLVDRSTVESTPSRRSKQRTGSRGRKAA